MFFYHEEKKGVKKTEEGRIIYRARSPRYIGIFNLWLTPDAKIAKVIKVGTCILTRPAVFVRSRTEDSQPYRWASLSIP